METTLSDLGDLEQAVLEHLWSSGPADVKAVHGVVGRKRDITHKTVQSTLKRLFEKGLLERDKEGRAFVYSPRVDRRELTERSVGEVVDELADGEMEVALQAFVGVADEAGEETLDELERLIEAHKNGEV
jgi:predicted transcriptional regulator